MCSKRKHKYLKSQYKLWAKNSILFDRRYKRKSFDLFNIKVEKGYVLMRNRKDLVGTEDYLSRLELT